MRWRFDGEIAGCGTSSGVRLVVGRWSTSPVGPFADVMVEQADGHRVLLAPTDTVADFVSSAYRFDEVLLTPVRVQAASETWHVQAGPLVLDVALGARTLVGRLLSALPDRVAAAPSFASAVDPVARAVLRGVRTTGRTRGGLPQWYGARDVHAVDGLSGRWGDADLGELRPVRRPVRFGFASAPARPCVTRVTTTIEVGDA